MSIRRAILWLGIPVLLASLGCEDGVASMTPDATSADGHFEPDTSLDGATSDATAHRDASAVDAAPEDAQPEDAASEPADGAAEDAGEPECDPDRQCESEYFCGGDISCTYSPQCDDDNPCTFGRCTEGGRCEFLPKVDGYPCPGGIHGGTCQAGECVSEGDCLESEVLSCGFVNACQQGGCDPDLGCLAVPRDCCDGIDCTIDDCEAWEGPTGCRFTPDHDRCDDGDPCTVNTCDPEVGCVTAPLDCDDGNLCTVNECDPEEQPAAPSGHALRQ